MSKERWGESPLRAAIHAQRLMNLLQDRRLSQLDEIIFQETCAYFAHPIRYRLRCWALEVRNFVTWPWRWLHD